MTPDRHTDELLLERVKDSDRGAFRELFELYQPPLFRHLLFRLGGDADLAHDIVQEAFTRLWERRGAVDPARPIYPWLAAVADNLAADHFRRTAVRRRDAARAGAGLHVPDPTPEEALDARALEEEVLRIVNTELGARCRTVFLLSRAAGKSNEEIARILSLSRKTVENQLNRALKVLRKRIGRGR